jgi:hypothetical protein
MTARYQFLPWVRRGAANTFRNPDDLAAVLARSDGLPLSLFPIHLEVNDHAGVDVALTMYGPGDVTGVDRRVVIRTDPPAPSADFEPNFLASIDFDPPDFPWLFTPAAAGEHGRLRPWLALVVVRDGDEASVTPDAGGPLPVLIATTSELPDLGEGWAWAHGQAIQPDASQSVLATLDDRPSQNLSRLICPRRLEPSTRYVACLVPAFDAGRRVGLGLEVEDADLDALAPAWTEGAGEIRLPVYYHWTFATGAGGDFETLARRLQGRVAPAGLGRRPLRADGQPYGLPDPGPTVLEGALTSTEDDVEAEIDEAFRERLRDVLDLSATEPVVTPPIYGRWQGARVTVPSDEETPHWMRELNLDPSLRAPAGLGARVVQDNQEQLVAAAWDQLGDAPAAAHLERRLEVAVAVLGSVVRRRVGPMEPGQLVQFLGPAHARLRASPETLHASLARQGLPPSFSSVTFRRAMRPTGTLSRRSGAFTATTALQAAATRLGSALPAIDPAPATPGLVTPVLVKGIVFRGRLTPAQLRYRQAVSAAQTYFDRFTGATPPRPPPAFSFTATFKAELLGKLDPRRTAPKRFYARLASTGGSVTPPQSPEESVLAGPSFPQPMYETLRDLSPELLLPGVGSIEADTVTLLESNPRFIEAFMVGLNHELAAELLWREFPSDLRATYFRTFWDARGAPEAFEQLPPIHQWDATSHLGDNFAAGGEQMVLLIRGALLQRYPDALIYALEAETESTLGTLEKLPLFRGRIEPDITFLGFDLTEEEARGDAVEPGWFFVIQEQPSTPRFGLDESRTQPLASWNDLAWTDVKTQPGDHLKLADLLAPPPPGPTWGRNAAHMAAILRQRPVRIALHARHLLPHVDVPEPPAPPPPPPLPPPPPPPPPRPPIFRPPTGGGVIRR